MKCTTLECKRVAKSIHNMPKQILEKQLIKCNKCFFEYDPVTRYAERPLPYQTRNAIGSLYAFTYMHERKN
jgi:hypothetical protein